MIDAITIALSKGRILEQTLPLLAQTGLTLLDDPNSSRKLILATNDAAVKVIIVRATDVPTYVQYGAADIGIAGKDILLEQGGVGLYEPLDLKIARCKLVVAGKQGASLTGQRLRIATKYVKTTQAFFAERGTQVDIIKLYGSMELAPLVGLADLIVDLVDTGNTLKANGLTPIEKIMDISSRLIVNRAAMKTKPQRIKTFITKLAEVISTQTNMA